MRWSRAGGFGWLDAFAACLAGLAQAVAIADPWTGAPHGWLQIVSLAVLAALLLRQPARSGLMLPRRGGVARAAVAGWLFATAWLAGSLWWLYISMHVYGGLHSALAAAAVVLLAALLALYYAVACGIFARFAQGQDGAMRASLLALLFAALWTLAELARGNWFTGLPWGAGGYAHVDGVLAAYAPLTGVYGIGFAAALLAAVTALALRGAMAARLPPDGVALAALVLVGALVWPRLAAHGPNASGPPIDVALLQGNIPQDEKFIPGTGIATALAWYGEQLRSPQASLTVTPETAIPLLPGQLPDGYLPALARPFLHGSHAALIGIPLGDAAAGYTNSALGIAPGLSQPYRYDKHHLVPFGEFVPRFFRWFTDLMQIPLGDFQRGALRQPSFAWHGERFAPNICYEDLFGEELAARFRDAASAPTVLVNMSNIAWFGDTVAIDQHLAISRMRALELERPMLRATNTGATAIIDADGTTRALLPRGERGVLRGSFTGRAHITPYALWASRWGHLPLWAACALLALLCAVGLGRRR